MSRRARWDAPEDALDKYREFHRYDPKEIGAFPASFAIPDRLYRGGRAIFVTYQSSKVDPETLRKPRRPVNYIHEHDAGVVTYLADAKVCGCTHAQPVPEKYRDVDALVRLGHCMGFKFEDEHGEEHEAEAVAPLPELYTVPDGTALLVIQSRRTVLAMMWGGGLGVFARGIDG